MTRRLLVVLAANASALLAIFASCATSTGPLAPPVGTGGSGGTGGSPLSGSSAISTGQGGTGGSGGAGDVGGAGGGSFDAGADVDASACAPFVETYTPACLACLDVACCDLAAMCLAVPDCFGYASCQQNCPPSLDGGSNECLGACTTSFPMAEPAFTALTTCLRAGCPGVCPY